MENTKSLSEIKIQCVCPWSTYSFPGMKEIQLIDYCKYHIYLVKIECKTWLSEILALDCDPILCFSSHRELAYPQNLFILFSVLHFKASWESEALYMA